MQSLNSRCSLSGFCFIALTCLAGFSSGCSKVYTEDFRTDVSQHDIEQILEASGLPLPLDLEPEGFWVVEQPTRMISMKAMVTREQLEEFFRSGPIKERDLLGPEDFDPNESEQFDFPPNRMWWDPGSHEELRVSTVDSPNGGVVNFGVLRSKKGKASIYITWFERPSKE